LNRVVEEIVMPSILIVCTANICRSPMAEALLRRKLEEEQVPGTWHVSSAGTWAEDGYPASDNGVRVMAARGLDTSQHRSRLVTEEMMRRADLVLTMTASHAESLRAEFPAHDFKVHRLTEMAGMPYDVADPYGGSLSEYGRTADELAYLIERGFGRIVALARENSEAGEQEG
jgi:protein-tyrosine-phosphatase